MAIINEAGYFISLSKCPFSPSTFITFLGFICDSVRQVFLLPGGGRSQVQGTKRGYSYLQGGYAEDPPAFCWEGPVLQPGHGAGSMILVQRMFGLHAFDLM